MQRTKKIYQQTFCETLDNCSEKLIFTENCLVKIDVDGPEYEIINSGKNFLSSNKVKSVMIEINSKNKMINTRFLVLCKVMGTKKFIKEIGSQNTRTMKFLTFFLQISRV